jgi:hypothetical protein
MCSPSDSYCSFRVLQLLDFLLQLRRFVIQGQETLLFRRPLPAVREALLTEPLLQPGLRHGAALVPERVEDEHRLGCAKRPVQAVQLLVPLRRRLALSAQAGEVVETHAARGAPRQHALEQRAVDGGRRVLVALGRVRVDQARIVLDPVVPREVLEVQVQAEPAAPAEREAAEREHVRQRRGNVVCALDSVDELSDGDVPPVSRPIARAILLATSSRAAGWGITRTIDRDLRAC